MSRESEIKEIIFEMFNINRQRPEEISPNERLIEDLGGDSLDLVELTMELESRFFIDIKNEEAAEIDTVQDVIDLVNKKFGVEPNQEVDPVDQLIDLFNNPNIFLTREDLKTTPPSTIKQFLDILNPIKERTTKNEKEDR